MDARNACVVLAPLVRYPDRAFAARLEAARAALAAWPDAAVPLSRFSAEAAELALRDMQEIYTRTFDLNPVCPLETGWHLFGEQYERGAFMAGMRGALTRYGIDEAGELPDHLSCALRLAGQVPAGIAPEGLADAARAVAKMIPALDAAASPYRHLLRAVAAAMVVRLAEVSHA